MPSRSGGTVDAADSKSAVRKGVRVRVPPSVPSSLVLNGSLFSYRYFLEPNTMPRYRTLTADMETPMTGTLRDTIHLLAADFAAGVLGVIRGASLQDILAETEGEGVARRGRGRPPSQVVASSPPDRSSRSAAAPRAARPGRSARSGRLQRRSASDIGDAIEQIVGLLAAHPKGLRAEQIRASLGLSARELPRPIAQALSLKQISKTGQKRATTYYAKGGGGAPAAGGKAGREKAASKGGGRKAGKRSARAAKGGRPASSAKPASRASETAAASGTTEAT